jgi:hypothetical protein
MPCNVEAPSGSYIRMQLLRVRRESRLRLSLSPKECWLEVRSI